MLPVSPVSRLSMPITVVAAIEQGFREVGADEAGGSGDHNALRHRLFVHLVIWSFRSELFN